MVSFEISLDILSILKANRKSLIVNPMFGVVISTITLFPLLYHLG